MQRAEPAFLEIPAPLTVHRKNRRRRRALSDRSTLPPNLLDQPGGRQNVADRRKRRPIQFRRVQPSLSSSLSCPARNVPGRIESDPETTSHRRSADAPATNKMSPLTDAVALTQLRHAERPRVVVAQHPNPLFHRLYSKIGELTSRSGFLGQGGQFDEPPR